MLALITQAIWCDIFSGGYSKVTNLWFLDSQPYFQDLKVLLDGIGQFRKGESPYLQAGSPFNYPMGWSIFKVLPFLSTNNLKAIGLFQIFFFLILCLWIFKKFHSPQCLSSFILFSPPVILALERGNCDVIIFILIGITFLLFKKPTTQLCAVLFAASLKVFPFGALLGWIYGVKNPATLKKPSILLVMFLFGIGIFYSLESFIVVSERTPRPFHFMSYGLASMPTLVAERLDIGPKRKTVLIISFYFAILVASIACWKTKVVKPFQTQTPNKSRQLFFAGLGCFLLSNLIGFNWEYRLIFLIFCMPEIFYLRYKKGSWFWIVYLFIIILMWQNFFKNGLDQFIPYLTYQKNHFYLVADLINIILFILGCSLVFSEIQRKLDQYNSLFRINK